MRRVYSLVFLMAACRLFDGSGSVLVELSRHHAIWNSKNVRSYDFDFQKLCFCAQTHPFRIEVRDNQVSRVVNLTTGDIIPSNQFGGWPTMDSLFVWTERRIHAGYQIEASYDPALGFPTRISGDIPDAVDDEFTETVKNFVVVPVALIQ